MLAERIHHHGIAVADLEGAVAWYCEKLGFDVEKRFALPEAHLEIVKLVAPSGVRIELLRSSREGIQADHRGPDEPGSEHLCFGVDDVEAAAAEARRRGITVVQAPQEIEASREKNCWIADPEGNMIEFIEEIT
jgi:catechol 2,3-dioxygenase-like lactoylglutathione lyase family enzyme